MLTRERADFRTVDRWATACCMTPAPSTNVTSTDGQRIEPTPHAREEALRIAREEPLTGLSPEEAVAAVRGVLDAVGDTCPEC
jgi:hypothetical protein